MPVASVITFRLFNPATFDVPEHDESESYKGFHRSELPDYLEDLT